MTGLRDQHWRCFQGEKPSKSEVRILWLKAHTFKMINNQYLLNLVCEESIKYMKGKCVIPVLSLGT